MSRVGRSEGRTSESECLRNREGSRCGFLYFLDIRSHYLLPHDFRRVPTGPLQDTIPRPPGDFAMPSRRDFLAATTAAASLAAFPALPAFAAGAPLQQRTIPSTGEQIPVIGMGTSGSFEVDAAGRAPLKDVLRRFVAGGGTVIDTSPNYS